MSYNIDSPKKPHKHKAPCMLFAIMVNHYAREKAERIATINGVWIYKTNFNHIILFKYRPVMLAQRLAGWENAKRKAHYHTHISVRIMPINHNAEYILLRRGVQNKLHYSFCLWFKPPHLVSFFHISSKIKVCPHN